MTRRLLVAAGLTTSAVVILAAFSTPTARRLWRRILEGEDRGLRSIGRAKRELDLIGASLDGMEKELEWMESRQENSLEMIGGMGRRFGDMVGDLEAVQDFMDRLPASEELRAIRREQTRIADKLADRVDILVDRFNKLRRQG